VSVCSDLVDMIFLYCEFWY